MENEDNRNMPDLNNRRGHELGYNLVVNYFAKYLFVNRYLDLKVEGKERVPKESCMIITHHGIYFDSFVVANAVDKRIHGWVAESVFEKRKGLYEFLELIPVYTNQETTKIERAKAIEKFNYSKALSLFWLHNTNDVVVLTNDGLAESCIDANDQVIDLSNRANHSGAANVAFEANVPVVPITSWLPKEHRRNLLLSNGVESFFYLEKHKRIPFRMYINEPIMPGECKSKKELQNEIRKRQLDGLSILERM
jgi:1-acyl-sn-glycerol-3-phosphate acyltransferase